MDLKHRWIEGDELEILEPILKARNWTSLNTQTSRAECVFDGDKLIAFNVLQLYPFVGPMYIDPDYRGTGIADTLAEHMVEFMADVKARGWLVIADNPATVKLCESHGMKRVESPVYLM